MSVTSSRKRRRTSTQPITSKEEEHDKHETFTQWSIDRGVQIHNVKPASLPGRGFGLVTTRKIKKHEQILFVPAKAMFKPDANVFGKAHAQSWTQKASPQVQLAMSILRECSKPESQYYNWKTTWPTSTELTPSLPLFWSKEMEPHIPPSLLPPLERQRSDYQKDIDTARAFAKTAGIDWSDDDFAYFWSIVNSRSFHFSPPGSRPAFMVLCPFIDYMNHGPSGTGVEVRQTPKGYEVMANRDYEPGEEILATYGAHPNDKLLIHYGFIVSTPNSKSPTDDDIRLDYFLLPAMSEATRSALQDVGFLGGYALLPATNELCFKTQVAVRAMLLTANEWEFFITNGEDLSGDQSGKNLELKVPTKKLGARFAGPFRVIGAVGSQAYRLALPSHTRIHNVFHVSLLEPWQSRAGEEPATSMPLADDEHRWEVEKVLGKKKLKGKQHYLIQWAGWPEEYNSWEPAEHCAHATSKLREFEAQGKTSKKG